MDEQFALAPPDRAEADNAMAPAATPRPGVPGVALAVGIQHAINAALHANDVPVLTELNLVNDSGEVLGDVTVDLGCDLPGMRPKTWSLAQVGPGQVRSVPDRDVALDGAWLASLTESVRATVTITARAGERELAHEARDVRFLAHNEWGGISVIPDLLAAFVQPNDPAIPAVLRKASDLLRAGGKPDSLEGYQATRKERLWEQVAAVWSAVCSFDIRYTNPPPSFEETGQRIRPPRQVIESRLATCLDLAVLFASCLEHIGLRPLIVLTKGHAFPGVWLSKHDFGTSVADDSAGLRTRLALDDLVLFESTLCCNSPAPAFRRACAVGAENIAASKDAEFQAVVDIRRARQRRIRPLGSPAGDYSRAVQPADAPPAGPPEIENAPALRDDSDPADSETPPTTPEGRLDRWRKRLLDLSGRNRLVNMSADGKLVLPIDCPDPAALEGMLANMRGQQNPRPLTLRPWPDLMSGSDPRSAEIHRNRMQEDAGLQFATEAFARRELMVRRREEQLQASLTEIYRGARAAQQEGGANTLFLTIGALLWRAPGKERSSRAPLILVPVTLHRESVRSSFQLRAHDDETRLNATLLELLRQDFGVRIPELESMAQEDGSGLDVKAVLDAFRLKVRQIPGWEVTTDVALTMLSFTKFLMWKDLADRADALRQNEVVRRLVDGPETGTADGQAASEGGSLRDARGGLLDDEPDIQSLVCPLEADSSQLRAVAAAARGESFVLIGPPGTGKSQTITNIIANTLARGHTVLFVAEKRAALEVVHRRLSSEEVGLGDFCLDLFSAKASKMAVLGQLDRAQQVREEADEAGWNAAAAGLATLRADLNGYVRELHRPGRNGWTAYRAIGCLLRAETAGLPEVALSWPSPDIHDAGGFQRLVESVEEAAATFLRLGDVAGRAALAGVDLTDWSPGWQAQLVEASRAAAVALVGLRDAVGPALQALGMPAGTLLTRQALETADILAGLLLDPAAPEAMWALGDGADETCEALYAAGELAREHAALKATLTGDWRPAAAHLPLEELLAEWTAVSGRWIAARHFGRKRVMARLAPAFGRPPADPAADLEALSGMRAREAEFNGLAERIAPVLGRRWHGMQTDFARVGQAIAFASRIRQATAGCAPDALALLAMREHVRRLLGDGADLLGAGGAIERPLRRFREAHAACRNALHALGPLCGRDAGAVVSEVSADWPVALAAHVLGWARSAASLRDWCAWRRVRQAGEDLGLGPVLTAIEGGTVSCGDAADMFRASYARWWVGLAVEGLPRLREFIAAQHEQRIERFRALDLKLRALAAKVVRSRLALSVPSAGERQKSPEYAVLTRELAKRQRHLPVRQLVARMPNAIRQLSPCVMMSPLSVAQYLPANAAAFDLVVFDEASQIATWDAVGAMGRGRQVIVVGDPRQLPPTQFFQRQLPDGDPTGDGGFVDSQDLESVLDECLGSGIPRMELTWHYRSRHESLIAFSNRQYYGGSLITFPSPVVRDAAVSFRYVPGAVYARGGARTNQAEAAAVVADVVGRLRACAPGGWEKSIGVVTFNAEQQALIENLLEAERARDPSLERFFSDEDCREPVLVKNLEGVQGEERDVVIFSLTYGPDAAGRFAMNFGPLNQAGGERRLNVAVTRAREAMVVFGSVRPEQIDLGRTRADGVAHLKLFLQFAERGARAFAEADAGSVGDFESLFEAAVAERLRVRGWTVHPQIGVSGFRIDLGVVDPGAPGAFLAGVECDGATYHRSASARDRDRLRQSVLEGLGWRILRVWSTDWWTNAAREADRVHVALEALAKAAAEGRAGAEAPAPPASKESAAPGEAEEVTPEASAPASDSPEGVLGAAGTGAPSGRDAPSAGEEEGLDPSCFYEEGYRPRLATLVEAVIRQEAPIRDEVLAQRVARAHGFQRTGRLIKEAVLSVVPPGCKITQEGEARFIWPLGGDPVAWSRFRAPPLGGQVDPADIPIQELAALARQVRRASGGDEAALAAMRDACGMGRLREASRERCLVALRMAGPPRRSAATDGG